MKIVSQLESEFQSILWPNEFIVEFKDGKSQVFVIDKGIIWDSGNNLDGKNENRPSITCAWKKKSITQQKFKIIEFFIDEVDNFKTVDGCLIWKPTI